MFFDAQTAVKSSYSMEHFRDWAGEIASSYFKAGALPTDVLSKIAQSENLTPDQTFLLAAEANKLIHQTKYASADEKYFAAEFPLADAKEAIKRIQVDGGAPKIAASFESPKFSEQGPDVFEMFGVRPEKIDKTASVKHQLKVAVSKSELLSQKVADRLLLNDYAIKEAEAKFIKQARQMVLDLPSSDARMKCLGEIREFIKEAGFGFGDKILAKLAYVLMKEGKLEPGRAKHAMEFLSQEKTADQKAPQEWISDNLPCRIVNGQHPLYISLKTVQEVHADRDKLRNIPGFVDDTLTIARQKVRAL